MFNFEKLGWWQHAIEFADAVYEKTRSFPSEKQFGLTNQMRRAARPRRKSMAQAASSVGRKIRIASSRSLEAVPRLPGIENSDGHARSKP
jgi:hypothetical protein